MCGYHRSIKGQGILFLTNKSRREERYSCLRARAKDALPAEIIAVKALENGVTVIGVTRGAENRFLHTEKLDEGEVWIAQFTEHISAMKIRGSATILTKHGEIKSGK